MGVFDNSIAAAERLIDKYGEECRWLKEGEAAPGADPWRDVRAGDDPDGIPCRIAWFPPNSNLAFLAAISGTEIPQHSEYGLMKGNVPFDPDLTDRIERTSGKTDILRLVKLAPNGVEPVLHTIFVA